MGTYDTPLWSAGHSAWPTARGSRRGIDPRFRFAESGSVSRNIPRRLLTKRAWVTPQDAVVPHSTAAGPASAPLVPGEHYNP